MIFSEVVFFFIYFLFLF